MGSAAVAVPRAREESADVVWLTAALACGVVVLFYHLGAYGLWDPDEGRHAEIAREMFAGAGQHRWALLTFNGAPYHDKPVLYYWLTCVAYALGGVTAYSARIVSACAATGVLATTLWWARRHWDGATAVASTLVLASTLEFVGLGRYGDLNMLLTFWITLGIVAGHTWIVRGGAGWGLMLAAVAAGGGTLTKGFVAPVLIGVTVLAHLWVRGRLALLRTASVLWAVVAYAAITLPWFVVAGVLDPTYLVDFVVEHHVQRFIGGTRHLHPKPFTFTPLMTLVAFLPWSPLLPALALRGLRRRRGTATDLCLCWAAVVVAFFTLSTGKLGTYVLPAMPPLALLMGRFLATVRGSAGSAVERRWTDAGLLVVGIVFIAVGPALALYGHWYWDLGEAVLWRTVVLTVVGVLIVWTVRVGRTRAAAVIVALGTIAGALLFYGGVAPRVSRLAGDVGLARMIRTADPAGSVPVVAYRTHNASLLFHLGRTVPRLNSKRRLMTMLRSTPATFVVTRPDHVEGLPPGLTSLGEPADGRHSLYAYQWAGHALSGAGVAERRVRRVTGRD